MSLRKIRTIFRKDMRDAIRDARVLVAVLVPFSIGIFYNLTFDDDASTPKANVVFSAADLTELPRAIDAVAGGTVDLRFRQVETGDEVRRIVGDDNADLGLIVPAGFDAAIAGGERPTLAVLQPPSTTFGGDYIAASIEPALRVLAGQPPPATIDLTAAPKGQDQSVIDRVGLRNWAVFASIVLMIAMISMLAVPVILAEETEKRTLDALVLIASYLDVIVAKALVGVAYVLVMVPLLLAITGLRPKDRLLFIASVSLLTLTLIGFGLLLGGLFKNANQLNTWSGILLLPVVSPAFIVGLPVPDLLEKIAGLFPTGGATKLLLDSASRDSIFSGTALSFAIVIVWGIAAYALLYWQLQRRQA